MATIGEHISTLRTLIREYSDDSEFTDPFLYNLMNSVRAKLLHDRYMKYRRVSDFDWDTFCVSLAKKNSHDCDCIEVGCLVRKSEIKLPKPITGRFRDLFKVMTLDGSIIRRVTEQQLKDEMQDDVLGGKPGYTIRSQKLIIFNWLDLKVVQVSAVWEDITDWAGEDYCDKTDEENRYCFNIQEDTFPMDDDLVEAMYIKSLNLMGLALQRPSDMTNDANPDIKL